MTLGKSHRRNRRKGIEMDKKLARVIGNAIVLNRGIETRTENTQILKEHDDGGNQHRRDFNHN